MPVKTSPTEPPAQMHVRKRNGSLEPIDINKIIRAVSRCAEGIPEVDPNRVAVKTIGGLYDGATTQELDVLSIQTAASFITENANYSRLAAALLAEFIRKEVAGQGIESFSQSFLTIHRLGLVMDQGIGLVQASKRKLDNAIKDAYNVKFGYYGLKNVYDNLLLRHPETHKVLETPQQYLMRRSIGRSKTATEAIKTYHKLGQQDAASFEAVDALSQDVITVTNAGVDEKIPFRPLMAGMGQAVAERTILRKDASGKWENWGDVARRVALGNTLLASTASYPFESEFRTLRRHIANGNTLMSGRHLQHGDADQPTRNMEVFTNCSTAAASFLEFYLLLNGSGVGRCYDDDMMLVNYDYAPNIRCVLDSNHPDFVWGSSESVRDARHKYGAAEDMEWFETPTTLDAESWKSKNINWAERVAKSGHRVGQARPHGDNVIWFQVPDSREGWAKAVELWEFLAYEKVHRDKLLILDFSPVRPKNLPIGGMQGRPASGPVPLMNAFMWSAALKGAGLAPWKQTIYVDHYFAECVLVGGARRAARMATKRWSDRTVLDFITVKRPLEYLGMSPGLIAVAREMAGDNQAQGFLWSSNNSVTVDQEFWDYVLGKVDGPLKEHALKVFDLGCSAAYADGTGEPGFINSHKLVQKNTGWDALIKGEYVESDKYKLNDETHMLMARLAKKAKAKRFNMITNPCGEITLMLLGAFCIIADVVPYHCTTLDEAEDCFRATTRALMRVNLMNSIYNKEVKRTNRIGVGMTGVHEFAWKFFKLGFLDLIDEEKSKDFWLTMARFNRAVADEAKKYAAELGVEVPHTMTTIKPAGTTSKLFGLTEGWHLPAMAYWLRWVQFRTDDPLVQQYKNNGYPTRELKSYKGTTIVGFPTAPEIATLGMGNKLVMAGDATPEQQFQWLMLGEKYWIHGTDENGVPLTEQHGNQISYTLKYKPGLVPFDHFKEMIRTYQSKVRCCSVMPQEKEGAYEYLPEEPITEAQYNELKAALVKSVWQKAEIEEEIGREHVGCDTGSCPIDFKSGAK